jgi:hypothetical protein
LPGIRNMTPKVPAALPVTLTDEQLAGHLRASQTLEDAPEALILRSMALISAAPPEIAWHNGLGEALRYALATLLHDSGLASAPALALRSGGGAVRQLLFSAEGRDIDLRVSPAVEGASGWVIRGQVLGPDLAGKVLLSAVPSQPDWPEGESDHFETVLSDTSEFRLGPVPPGHWRMTLLTEELALDLPTLDLSRAP